ncbi:MAG: ATP-binding cassette domain-containing protein [Candidatus Eisenbacteria bacterium]|nr:ATP-binding cassette domain-containing protein [Candidatus Eisenbacteria bacterium]
MDVRQVSKSFGRTVAVDGVSFSVGRGEVVGFLGPNAAGKTTTMRILTCFLAPDAGGATVAGCDVLEDPLGVRRRTGYLPESAPLYTDMTVDEHLHFVATVRGLRGADRRSRIDDMVDLCGLTDVLGSPVGALSKGYRQRVGLANTLIHDPQVLILDEPTTGLDPTQIIEIRELIRRIGTERTVLLSTHVLPEVEATCTRVLIINEGRIAAEGTTDELRGQSFEAGISVSLLAGGADVDRALASLPSVSGLERLTRDEHGYVRFLLSGDSGTRLADDVFELVRDRGWRLRELSHSSVSLEDIFLDLTSAGRGPSRGEQRAGTSHRPITGDPRAGNGEPPLGADNGEPAPECEEEA